MESQEEILVETRELSKHFPGPRPSLMSRRATLRAVEKVNLKIRRGEVLGLVGESGCGKSTLGQTILNLYPPTSGQIFFEGDNIQELKMGELRLLRRKMQIVFQDPYSSLDPRMPIGQAIAEPLVIHKMASGSELEDRVSELLQTVGLNPGLRNRYPHEFSGGQQQRIALARALAVTPSFLVADEPISSMDVSIQGQLINLLERLREQMGLTYLFISHDLRMVRHIADRVAVMYLGRIV
ncbi:MAG: dipeptide/oligopeptide/nickel ABC transporter ATP-binding protein, partial [Caldilineaceae bacterium]|nr:dipeptide/oligopeptide/nickel ABC transporter ATP-binding protein [Caldilineaceae bacterium]